MTGQRHMITADPEAGTLNDGQGEWINEVLVMSAEGVERQLRWIVGEDCRKDLAEVYAECQAVLELNERYSSWDNWASM